MIPLRNLYWVFAYAWEHFPGGKPQDVGGETCPDLPNLLARMLLEGFRRLARRGLDRGYLATIEDTRSPRGRLLLDQMIKRNTLQRGVAVCEHDEITPDVLHNQILKATAVRMSRAKGVTRLNRQELTSLARRLGEISDIRMTPAVFTRVQLSRNARQYRPLLKLCELVSRSLLPEPDGTGFRFASILEDEVTMSAVFEAFLRSFYRVEQAGYRVGRERMRWPATATAEDLAWLPLMETDVTLRSRARVLVVEAKYYREAFGTRYGQPKVHAANLYQLTSYLRHTSAPQAQVDGLLLYAAATPSRPLHYVVDGHELTVATLDFSAPFGEVKRSLLALLQPHRVVGSPDTKERPQLHAT